jgi:transcriptional regulator with XRE-family HTH domain
MSTPTSFHQKIADARASLQLLQSEVARRAGITPRRMSSIEQGTARPRPHEIEAIVEVLRLCAADLLERTDWEKGSVRDGWLGTTPEALRAVGQGPLPELQPSKNSFASKLEIAQRSYSSLVAKLEGQISRRADARSAWAALREVWYDSALEVLLWLHLAAVGAKPVWASPLRIGFRLHPVCDWHHEVQAGDAPRVGFWLAGVGIAIPQVSLLQPKCRLDCLLGLGPGRFAAMEVDGEGHNGSWDRVRERELKLPVVRYEGAAVQDRRFLSVLTEQLGMMRL